MFRADAKTPFQEQVGTMSRAGLLVGVAGAAFTNMIFMPPESVMLVIQPFGMRFSYEEMAYGCGHTAIAHIVPCKQGTGVTASADVEESLKTHNLFARGCKKAVACKNLVNRRCMPDVDVGEFVAVFKKAFSYAFAFHFR